YFVMAYVDGESLAARLKRRERLPPEEARRIMMETADALGAGHALGIIHRDVKPDNILLEGSRGRTVLTHSGIAKEWRSTAGPRARKSPRHAGPQRTRGAGRADRGGARRIAHRGARVALGGGRWHDPRRVSAARHSRGCRSAGGPNAAAQRGQPPSATRRATS